MTVETVRTIVRKMTIDTADNNAINDWLPVTASRNAKWWYSAFHNLTAMVGAGVLTLPYAMSMMGWYTLFNLNPYKFIVFMRF